LRMAQKEMGGGGEGVGGSLERGRTHLCCVGAQVSAWAQRAATSDSRVSEAALRAAQDLAAV